MGAPYGIDLRKRTMILLKKGMLKEEIAFLLQIGTATISRWKKREKDGKELISRRPKNFIKKIDPKIIQAYLKKHPDATLLEMKKALGFSITAIWYRIKQLGITLKKSHSTIKKPIKKQEKPLKKQ